MKIQKTRRAFLKTSSAGAIGALFLSRLNLLAETLYPALVDRFGIILYSIHDAMIADTIGSLKKVAEYGYKYLELADYSDGKFYGYTPKEFKKIVNDLGMKIISSHTEVEAEGISISNAQEMADDHAALGVKYCIQPWINEEDRNIETYKKLITDWNKVGEIMKNTGIQFGYHNHNFEFANLDGIVPYFDIFLKEMDPDLITMELDMYWVNKAGHDPVEIINKYPGRFQLFHLKDMSTHEPPNFEANDITKADITMVGEGVIDFKRILAAKDTAGMQYMFVEDDNQNNGKPFIGIKTSADNLQNKILIE